MTPRAVLGVICYHFVPRTVITGTVAVHVLGELNLLQVLGRSGRLRFGLVGVAILVKYFHSSVAFNRTMWAWTVERTILILADHRVYIYLR